jgi:uncharacterized repeat protein (TIGR01451 family)
MNKKSFFTILILLVAQCCLLAQVVDIPDANFKNALVNTLCVDTNGDGLSDRDADLNNDGEIQVSEAETVKSLDVSYAYAQSLIGIKSFNQLEKLNCSSNQLINLDVQGLSYLKELNCNKNQINTLFLQGLSNLVLLMCEQNQLISLDVQGLSSLKVMYCEVNQLATLDMQGLSNLESLSCGINQLTTLNVQGLTNLEVLICDINKLTTLNVEGLTNLAGLLCSDNQLVTLEVKNLSNLVSLGCGNNQLTILNVTGLSSLTQLDCSSNQLTYFDARDMTSLKSLWCKNNQLKSLFIKNGSNETLLDFSANPNLSYICCDPAQITSVYNQTLQNGQINCVVSTACYNNYTFLNGHVLRDQNLNCQKDTQEIGLEKRIVKAEKDGQEPLFSISNNQGQYQMDLDTGLYKITTYLFNNYSEPCEDSIWVNLPQVNDSATVDLLLQPVISCPLMEVNIASNFIRRCFDNQYIIQYCNAGTAPAPNAQVTINLSDDVAFVSSTIPGSNVGGNNWQFSVGEVQPDDCGSFSLVFHVICDSTVLGQSICATAHITPDSICTPASTSWSGAQVMVDGFCEGDSVRFTIQNIGFGDMTEEQEYIVIEDDVILFQSPFILDALESIVFRVPANGSTWLLQAEQEPTFPFVSMPFASVEGCGLNLGGLFSLGFVTQFSEQDGNPFFSRECREVVGSYDPNEKLAQPKGVYDKHFIYPNTEIEYQINFQNTGTDTAFTVVIRDTLSYGLDAATFRAGISSHTYQVDISGYGVLKFTFDDILLPDSNVNEAASHGFVRFRITPKDTLQLGTRVENRAGIYFDFNPPIITNTVFHTVDTGFLERKMVAVHGLPDAENGRIFPNPVRAGAYLFFEDMSAAHRIVLMDPYGKVVLQVDGKGSHKIRIPDGLAGGVYFLEWRGEQGSRFWGKLVVLE